MVLIHSSMATSFAVLARKPILSLTSFELDRSNYGQLIRAMSSALVVTCLYERAGHWRSSDLCHSVDEKKYRAYESDYLRSEKSTESVPWGALIEYINHSAVNTVTMGVGLPRH